MQSKNILIRRGDVAMIIVDMQERLLSHIDGHERILANCIKLARFANIMDMPVIVCEQTKLGPTVAPLRDALEEKKADFSPVAKDSFSCFGSLAFMDTLESLNISALLLAGIESHVCILQTALHALAHSTSKCDVHVVADATGSRAPEDKEFALARLRHGGVTVTSTEAAIFEIMGTAACEEFKQVLALVK